MPCVDIIIVNYNSTDCAIKSIESIYKTIGKQSVDINIVDNASTDNPERMLKSFPEIKLFRNKNNMGFSRAVNGVLYKCKAPYIVLLNPDTIVLDGFFDTTLSYLERNKSVGILGPKIYDHDGSVQGSARRFPTLLTSMFGRKSPLSALYPNNPITSKEFICFKCNGIDEIEADWVSGACMVIRRKTIEQVSGFDERFFLYWEDTDLCKRVQEIGWKVVYYPKAEIIHIVGESSSTKPVNSIYHFHHSCYKLFLKHSKIPIKLTAPIVLCGLMARCLFVVFLNSFQNSIAIQRRKAPRAVSNTMAAHRILKLGISKTAKRFFAKEAVVSGRVKYCSSTNYKPIYPVENKTFYPKANIVPIVLIINQYFPPDRSATAGILEIIGSFLSVHYRVSILAGRPSYQPHELQMWKLLKITKQKNLNIIRVGSTAYSRSIMVMRILNYCSYLILASPVAFLSKAHLIMALTDPPLAFLIAVSGAKIKKLPFVYYIQDLHPDMAITSGMIRSTYLTRLWERIHRWGLKNADLVIVLGEDMRRLVLNKGVNPEKTIVIRHGSQKLIEDLLYQDHPIVRKLKCGFGMTIMHAGNIGFYGAWDTIIAAAQKLRQNSAGFVFVGEGAAKADFLRKANGCDKIRFLPFRPRSEFECVLAAGDIHLITIRHGLEGTVVPSKLYPIIAAGRPVLALASTQSDVVKIVHKYDCGVTVDPSDPDALAQVIDELSESPKRLYEMGQNAKVAAERLSQTGQMNKLVASITQLLPSSL